MRPAPPLEAVIIRANNRSDCSHGCRYCPIRRKKSEVALDRYEAFVLRVREWAGRQSPQTDVHHLLGYHFDYDRDDLETLRRLNGETAQRGISLGGIQWRDDSALRDWLSMYRDYGLKTVHATLGGAGKVHDRWNHKPGNYDMLVRTLRTAGELGLTLGQRILVSRSTLPTLEGLIEELDTLPRTEGGWRYAIPFFYNTTRQKAQPQVEADRIDEAGRDALPEAVQAVYTGVVDGNRSEREWIARLAEKPAEIRGATVIIRLTAANMARLEKTPVDDIVGGQMAQIAEAYRLMPSYDELIGRWSDPAGTLMYATPICLEKLWLDRWRDAHPEAAFDQSLTHCWFGG